MTAALLTMDPWDAQLWELVLNKRGIQYRMIDISASHWLEKCLEEEYSIYLARSPGTTNLIQQIFIERMQILAEELGKNLYPSLTELRLHENKKYLAEWLKASDLPHPRTDVLFSKNKTSDFLKSAKYPLVFKQNIGSSGKGVRIIQSDKQARRLLKLTFRKGIKPRLGPNLRTASFFRKLKNAMRKKDLLKKRLTYYKAVSKEPQNYMILQEYITHTFEWRVVVIGDSFFAHKKMVSGTMASGSLLKNYDDPPLELMDFVRNLSIKHKITSTSMDIFESERGYLINEIQTYFGQSDPFQMKVGGEVGRYRFMDGRWVFEAGDWASNQCYDLRLEHVLTILEQKQQGARES